MRLLHLAQYNPILRWSAMPIYEYYCGTCDLRFEKLKPISAAGQPQPCPTCSNPAPAAITRPARITGAVEGGGGEGEDLGSDLDSFGMGGMGGAGDHGHSH